MPGVERFSRSTVGASRDSSALSKLGEPTLTYGEPQVRYTYAKPDRVPA